VNWLRSKPLFVFTYWGVVGASFWVPAGFAYIAAVSMCGVATATVLNTGVNSVVQFLISIMTDESMKTYGVSQVPLAPFYLVALIMGMMGLIFSPTLSLRCFHKVDGKDALQTTTASTMSFGPEDDSVLLAKPVVQESRREFMIGVALAMTSGIMGGLKFGITNIGHQIEAGSSKSEEVVASELGVFESYMMSFGVGCAVSTTSFFFIFALLQKVRGQEMPSAEFPVMKLYGFLAGALWMGSYMCLQAANNLGGSGSFGPAGNASQLITAGLWGLLYYREVKDPKRVACWVVSAAWTIAFVVLLAGELESK